MIRSPESVLHQQNIRAVRVAMGNKNVFTYFYDQAEIGSASDRHPSTPAKYQNYSKTCKKIFFIRYNGHMTELNKNDTSGEYEPSLDDLQFAVDMAKEAGEYIRSALGEAIEAQWKADNTPVTKLDITVNSMIIDKIKARNPSDQVYGEEESSEGAIDYEYSWVVDPIDGTQALGKLDTFTVCIAKLDRDGQPVISVVYNPLRDEVYTARKGERSYLNGQPLKVSDKETIKSSYVHFGSALRFDDLATNGVVYDRLEGQGAKIFNTRSLAHGCVEVARGEFEGAFVGVKTPFEAAAVKLIIEGAGGRVTNLYGEESGRLDGEIEGLVVSNGHIHDVLLTALRP